MKYFSTCLMLRTASLVTIGCWFALACSPSVAQEEVGAEPGFPVELCNVCHGENGAGNSDEIPAIGGQREEYLAGRLRKFKQEYSGSELMQAIVANLSEPQMRAAAAYFSRLPYIRKKQSVDPEKERLGKEVYLRLCQLCHSDMGRSSVYAEYPLLAGQNLAYLQKTMADILAGRRKIESVKETRLSLLYSKPEKIYEALHFFAAQEVDPLLDVPVTSEGSKPRRRRFP